MRYTALAALAALGVSSTAALAIDSSVTMTSSMSPDALWKKVGDFCGIASWHPAIEKCVLSADGKERTLSLKGGGTSRRGAGKLGQRRSQLHVHHPVGPAAGHKLSLDDYRDRRRQGLCLEMDWQV